MRPTQIAGLLLIVAGVYILWKQPTYATRQDVVQIGDFKASVDQREAVPAWIGAVAVGAGTILLLAANRRREG